MNAEPRRRGFALGVVGLGGSIVSTVEVRTIGVVIVDTRDMGRMITSSPSKVRAESRLFNSVSGLTASVLTTTGKRTASNSLMYSEDIAKSRKSEDFACKSVKKRMTVCKTVACPPSRSFLGWCVSVVCQNIRARAKTWEDERLDSISFVKDIDLCRERAGTLSLSSVSCPLFLSLNGESGSS
jgi:hypothetical protein